MSGNSGIVLAEGIVAEPDTTGGGGGTGATGATGSTGSVGGSGSTGEVAVWTSKTAIGIGTDVTNPKLTVDSGASGTFQVIDKQGTRLMFNFDSVNGNESGDDIWPALRDTWDLGIPLTNEWKDLWLSKFLNFGPDGFNASVGEVQWETGVPGAVVVLGMDFDLALGGNDTVLALNGPSSTMAGTNNAVGIAYYEKNTSATNYNGLYVGMEANDIALIRALWDGTNAIQPQAIDIDAGLTVAGINLSSPDGLGLTSGWQISPLPTPEGGISAIFPGIAEKGDLGTVSKGIRTGYFGTSVVTPDVIGPAGSTLNLSAVDGDIILTAGPTGTVVQCIAADEVNFQTGSGGGASGFSFVHSTSALTPNATTNTLDIGTSSAKWRSIYLGTSAITPQAGPGGSADFTLDGVTKFTQVASGAGTAALGIANSPATVLSAPYRWITCKAEDGTVVYIPAWK